MSHTPPLLILDMTASQSFFEDEDASRTPAAEIGIRKLTGAVSKFFDKAPVRSAGGGGDASGSGGAPAVVVSGSCDGVRGDLAHQSSPPQATASSATTTSAAAVAGADCSAGATREHASAPCSEAPLESQGLGEALEGGGGSRAGDTSACPSPGPHTQQEQQQQRHPPRVVEMGGSSASLPSPTHDALVTPPRGPSSPWTLPPGDDRGGEDEERNGARLEALTAPPGPRRSLSCSGPSSAYGAAPAWRGGWGLGDEPIGPIEERKEMEEGSDEGFANEGGLRRSASLQRSTSLAQHFYTDSAVRVLTFRGKTREACVICMRCCWGIRSRISAAWK